MSGQNNYLDMITSHKIKEIEINYHKFKLGIIFVK